MKITGISDIEATSRKLEAAISDILSSGGKLDLTKMEYFFSGPYLHTGDNEKSSAEFEREQKYVFDYLRSITEKIDKALK